MPHLLLAGVPWSVVGAVTVGAGGAHSVGAFIVEDGGVHSAGVGAGGAHSAGAFVVGGGCVHSAGAIALGADGVHSGSGDVFLVLAGLEVLFGLPSSWFGSTCRTLFLVFPATCCKVWALASPLL